MHLKINIDPDTQYQFLKIDAFRLNIGQGGRCCMHLNIAVQASKTRIPLLRAISSFKNIEPAYKGLYPVLRRYRAYAPSKQVGRRQKGLTNSL